MARKYEQRRRAEKQEETRQRIVQAAVELHQTIGPAGTSMSAVAGRAGVQRNTLYRHFPDDRALLMACSGHYREEHPLPDPSGWATIPDPVERLRHGLRELYAYYETTEEMTARVVRDAEVHPVVREVSTLRMSGATQEIAGVLLSAWPRGASRKSLVAAVTLALGFHTWQSLVRAGGLATRDAADLMAGMVGQAATSRRR